MKTKQIKLKKERNPFVQHLIGKKQGAHGKTKKAVRRDEKVQLRKECFGQMVAILTISPKHSG
jgi:hypothetical protein